MNTKGINRNVWALTLSLCLGVIGYSTLSAQAAEKGGVIGVEDFKVRLAANEKKLVGIEALLGRVESSKLITERDSDDFGKSMHEYAEAMKVALDSAGSDAQLLRNFEQTAKGHEHRLKQLEARTQKIDTQLKAGTIRLDKPLLQKMSPQDRGEFKQYLAPEGVKEMEKLHPDLFKGGLPPPGAMKPGASAVPADGGYAAQGWYGTLLEAAGNLLVSPAQAEIAAQTATFLAQQAAAVTQAWATYNACWNNAGTCWKPWTWWAKAKCTAALIARLA